MPYGHEAITTCSPVISGPGVYVQGWFQTMLAPCPRPPCRLSRTLVSPWTAESCAPYRIQYRM